MIRQILVWTVYLCYFLLAVVTVVWLVILVREARMAQSALYGAAQARADAARSAKGDIRIGVAGAWSNPVCLPQLQGIRLGIEYVNGSGGIRGRHIVPVEKDDQGDPGVARRVAQELAEDRTIVAVIGHQSSQICLETASVYDYYGMVMVTSNASTPRLTREGRRRVFRTVPNDLQVGDELARLARRLGLKRLLIYRVDSDYGIGLANAFHSSAEEQDLDVADRMMYDDSLVDSEMRQQLDRMNRYFSADALMLVGVVPSAVRVVKFAREVGMQIPILSGDGLDEPELIPLAGPSAEGAIVASTFDPDSTQTETVDFVRRYRERYGIVPETDAAEGYDAALLLAHAMGTADSPAPDDIAEALRNVKSWKGATGECSMTDNGDAVKRTIFRTVSGGRFRMLDEQGYTTSTAAVATSRRDTNTTPPAAPPTNP